MSFGAPYPSNSPNPKGEWERRGNKGKTGADKALRWIGIVGAGLIVLAGGLGVGSMLFHTAPAQVPAPAAAVAFGNATSASATTAAPAISQTQAAASTTVTSGQAQVSTSAPAVSAGSALRTNFEAIPAPNAPKDQPVPLFGPGYDPKDGKPVYICGAESDSALTLLAMQMSGKDVAHGFHLGIVPKGMSGPYNMSEETHVKYMVDGVWDCMVERVDENAELNMGIITAIVDESAGGLGIYARGDLKSYEDLKGKRIGYVDKTSSRYFLLYTLAIMPIESQKTVHLQAFDTIDQELAAFKDGKLDAISGWQPYLSQTRRMVVSR